MKSFKYYMEQDEYVDGEWTKALSGKELHDHLESTKSKRVFNAMAKHPWHRNQMSYSTGMGGNMVYKHRVMAHGDHEIKSASTAKPKEHLHYNISNTGKVWNIHKYGIDDEMTKHLGGTAFRHIKSLHNYGE